MRPAGCANEVDPSILVGVALRADYRGLYELPGRSSNRERITRAGFPTATE